MKSLCYTSLLCTIICYNASVLSGNAMDVDHPGQRAQAFHIETKEEKKARLLNELAALPHHADTEEAVRELRQKIETAQRDVDFFMATLDLRNLQKRSQ